MSIDQEKMIVEALPSLYPLKDYEEDAIHAVIDALPPAQPEPLQPWEVLAAQAVLSHPEPHWIPVTERLPEDNVYVLLTIRRMDDSYNHVQFISTGYISWNHQCWWCAHDGNCKDANVEVLAWMPLPEPYKPTVPPECEGDCGWCKPSVIEKCKGVTE